MIQTIGNHAVNIIKTNQPREYHFTAALGQGNVVTVEEMRSLKRGWVYDDSEEGAVKQIADLLAAPQSSLKGG